MTPHRRTPRSARPRHIVVALLLPGALASCAPGGGAGGGAAPAPDAFSGAAAGAERPVPYPVVPPADFRRALERGTRSPLGAPGPRYWQPWAEYDLRARLDTAAHRLEGSGSIRYRNESPDTLRTLYLHLIQNVHAPGTVRNEPHDVTGGVSLERLSVGGVALDTLPAQADGDVGPGYRVEGTLLRIRPPEPLPPGGTAELEAAWSFEIPRRGAGARMGRGEGLYYLAYWYPQMAVYDDVVGWHTDPFLGRAELHAGFGGYDVEVDVPAGWVVRGTGRLRNPERVLAPAVLARLRAAASSDTVVRVLAEADLEGGAATRSPRGGRLAWRFRADTVRDAAFSVTRGHLWDATRAEIGDRDGDGEADGARVEALYRPAASLWPEVAGYARHALGFHSRYTALPYPWEHMTAVEGGGIIGGGMEFPMATLIGDYEARGDSALYYVTSHELAHMWVPMIVATDEKRHGWMDEGMTSFLENRSRPDFYPGNPADSLEREIYLEVAREDGEGEVMRRTDHHATADAWRVATYAKPATVLVALRGVIGEEAFREAYRTFHDEWRFRHPKPWDLFNTFERVAGRDLDWFWRSWLYETWTLDHAVADVSSGPEGTRVVIEDRGLAPMPARLLVTRVDGERLRREVPVETWLAGSRRAEVTVPPGPPVIRVELDPGRAFPDVDRGNDVWAR